MQTYLQFNGVNSVFVSSTFKLAWLFRWPHSAWNSQTNIKFDRSV